MRVLYPIPVALDPGDVAVRLRLDPAKAGYASATELVVEARGLIDPRAAFSVGCVGSKGEGTVEIAGIQFESRILRKHLDQVSRVFPYIVTIGPDLEREAGAQGDLLRQYYLEEIANIALEQAAGRLADEIERDFGLSSLSNLSPGSLEDWPITEQPKLFSIFGDTERLIGVRLTDSMLMVPRKSISGILFPSDEGFVACQLCDRENCQGRKAPYLQRS